MKKEYSVHPILKDDEGKTVKEFFQEEEWEDIRMFARASAKLNKVAIYLYGAVYSNDAHGMFIGLDIEGYGVEQFLP